MTPPAARTPIPIPMPRIPSSLIASIKSSVSCRAVLEARGAVFTKHGPDWACSCPLGSHADSTPSFVVSESKNLWRCHGCGEGGDVLILVQKLCGIGFRHAVELLQNGGAAAAAAVVPALPSAASAGKPARLRGGNRLPCPLELSASAAALNDQVVSYYARRLHDPAGASAREYLEKRGLWDVDFLRRFSVGLADRSLGLRIPERQSKAGAELRAKLEESGWFRASSGHEHFAGSVVFPIHAAASDVSGEDGAAVPAGSVIGCYGRKILDNLRTGTPKHLYLSGKHHGIWNAGADLINADGRVIIAESIIDAASIWLSGHRNVTASYGVHGWTTDHDRALAAGNFREAVIAFDRDQAGDEGSKKLAEHLIACGVAVFRAVWPENCKDANDVLTARNLGPEAIRAAIREAVWIGGASSVMAAVSDIQQSPTSSEEGSGAASAVAPAAVAGDAETLSNSATFSSSPPAETPAAAAAPELIEASDGSHTLRLGTREYRLKGLHKSTGDATTLRVNLRVSTLNRDAAHMHIDTIDLYQSRQRSAFATAAAQDVGIHADVIRADLGTVLLQAELVAARTAEAEATAAAAAASSEAPLPDMTEEQREAAMRLLKNPQLLATICADLGACGLVGEAVNKQAAVLALASRLSDQPLAILVQSTSAAGKTTLMDAVLSFLPDNHVRKYSAITGKSPFYLGSTPLRHRVLAIAEEEGARRASYALKLLQSDGKLSMAATGKDPDTGRLTTQDYTVEGPVMLFLTTTAIDLDPELVNRCLVLSVDESPEQTAAIHDAQRRSRSEHAISERALRQRLRRLHQHAQALLKPLPVIIPEAISQRLRCHAATSRLRRDHQKFLNLICASTLLHQYQRETRHFPEGVAEPADSGISGDTCLIATWADVEIARDVAAHILPRTLDDLPPQTRKLWDALREFVSRKAQDQAVKPETVEFTRQDLQKALAWSYFQVRVHMDRLEKMEYIASISGVFGQSRRHRIVAARLDGDGGGGGDDRPRSPVFVVDEFGSGDAAGAAAPAPEMARIQDYDARFVGACAPLEGSFEGVGGSTLEHAQMLTAGLIIASVSPWSKITIQDTAPDERIIYAGRIPARPDAPAVPAAGAAAPAP